MGISAARKRLGDRQRLVDGSPAAWKDWDHSGRSLTKPIGAAEGERVIIVGVRLWLYLLLPAENSRTHGARGDRRLSLPAPGCGRQGDTASVDSPIPQADERREGPNSG